MEQILDRTEGVPLFVEELTNAVLESGSLVSNSDRLEPAGPISTVSMPATLQASLVARLDRLAPVKEVAQIGAVIGREFSYQLIAAVAPMMPEQLADALQHLARSGLVFRRGQGADAVFVFKHALIQDAAYQTLLRARRQQLHIAVAQAIESRFPEFETSQPQSLARHLTQGGVAVQAIPYWLKAGQLSASRSASIEAAAQLRQGIELIPGLPAGPERDQMELSLQVAFGAALIATKGYAAQETLDAFERASVLSIELNDRAAQQTIASGLFVSYYNRADFGRALAHAKRCLDLAETSGDRLSQCSAHRMVAAACNSMGLFERALPHARQSLALYDPIAFRPQAWRMIHDMGVAALCQLAIPLWSRGRVAESLQAERQAVDSAGLTKHQNTIGYALFYAGALSAFRRRDKDAAALMSHRLCEHGRANSMPQWVAWGTVLQGAALILADRAREGLDLVREGIEHCDRMQNNGFRPLFLGILAEGEIACGEFDLARNDLKTALETAQSSEERWYTSELWRIQAKLLAASSDTRSAPGVEQAFQCAISTAKESGWIMMEARALQDLVELPSGIGMDANVLVKDLVSRASGQVDADVLEHITAACSHRLRRSDGDPA